MSWRISYWVACADFRECRSNLNKRYVEAHCPISRYARNVWITRSGNDSSRKEHSCRPVNWLTMSRFEFRTRTIYPPGHRSNASRVPGSSTSVRRCAAEDDHGSEFYIEITRIPRVRIDRRNESAKKVQVGSAFRLGYWIFLEQFFYLFFYGFNLMEAKGNLLSAHPFTMREAHCR